MSQLQLRSLAAPDESRLANRFLQSFSQIGRGSLNEKETMTRTATLRVPAILLGITMGVCSDLPRTFAQTGPPRSRTDFFDGSKAGEQRRIGGVRFCWS